MPLQRIDASIHSNGADAQSLLGRSSSKHDFDFLLPPGEYTLTSRGAGNKGKDSAFIKAPAESADLAITVSEGQSTLDLGVIDLRLAKLAAMIGRPAPEIGPMKAWRNGSAVTLAQLRGQTVWLHFDGNGSIAALFLPRLVELHEAYADKGLTVVAIYNCDSMAELEKRWADADKRVGRVPDVPFRIAIDGGESTFYRGTDRERPGATYGRYDVTTMPLDVLIDSAGNVMGQIDPSHAKEALSQMLGGEKEALSQVPREEQKSPLPNWRPGFNAVYRLADGEILKRVAPPFIPERMEYYHSENGRHPDGPSQLTFHWDGQLKKWGMVVGFGNPDMRIILNLVLEIQTHEYDGPTSLLDIEMPGDWIIRNEASQEVKLEALEELVARDLGRKIRFEQRSVEREVIVATGTFRFHPPVGTYESTSVHLYATQMDPDERGGGGTADSLGKFLQKLGNHVHMPVINRAEHQEDTRIPYRHHRSSYVGGIQDEQERAMQLKRVLDHLTEQTELRFEIRVEPVPVWYVTEQTAP